jgi:two-component system phosphate regulon sensor histidine kinase PhoR
MEEPTNVIASTALASDVSGSVTQEEHDNWIAEVSHELRLPLANIKLLVETLIDGAVEEPITAMRMLNRTKEEVIRLQNLVNDLLSHEKLQSGRSDDMRFTRVSIQRRTESVLETTRELAEEKGVILKSAVESGFELLANEEQIDQVLINLVENAIKFTPSGGSVVVRAGGPPPFIEVEDSGIGMAEAEIPKIFQRFYRVDRGRTRGSTGLGLSIVKHIVDLHGAKIAVTSKEGSGSKFRIEFP